MPEFEKLRGPLAVIKRSAILWWDDLINAMLISVVWLLAWATIVLGPPATFGLFAIAQDLVAGDVTGVGGLLAGGKRYFWKSWLWMVINIVVMILMLNAIFFYAQIENTFTRILAGIFAGAGAAWVIAQFYALPFYFFQENPSLRIALRNGLYTFLAAPVYTLVVFGLVALVAVSFTVIFPLVLGGPVFIALLGSVAVRERVATFRQKMEPNNGAHKP